MRTVVSPDGLLRASVVEIDHHGGATVGFSYEVRLREVNRANSEGVVWSAYSLFPVRIEWQGNDTVLVTVANRDRLYSVETTPHLNVHARTVALAVERPNQPVQRTGSAGR